MLPDLRPRWGLNTNEASVLIVVLQLGFVVGAVASAVLGLCDRVAPRTLIAISAIGASGANAAIVLADASLQTPRERGGPEREWEIDMPVEQMSHGVLDASEVFILAARTSLVLFATALSFAALWWKGPERWPVKYQLAVGLLIR